MKLTTPTVHLNGTSKPALLDGYEKACAALQDCIQTVNRETVPNARDYYVQGDQAYNKAAIEHQNRLFRLEAVKAEILSLFESVDAQGTR